MDWSKRLEALEKAKLEAKAAGWACELDPGMPGGYLFSYAGHTACLQWNDKRQKYEMVEVEK